MSLPRNLSATRMAARRTLKPLVLALAGLELWSLSHLSSAQTAPVDKRDDKGGETVQKVDTIVITAGKRSERQREVAGSVTALQGGDLESKGVRDHEDLFRLTPGVQYSKGEGDSSVITIRGIGTSASGNFVQSTSGIYIEDVPFNDPYIFRTAPDVAPFDLERVEILRGPQGVLFGSSSMGGAVRYLFNKPNLKAQEFSALGTVSSTSGGGTNHAEFVMGNVPLGATTGLRMVLFNREDAGTIDNSTLGKKDTNKLHQSGGRVLATFAPTRELGVTAMFVSQTTKVDDSSNVTDIATMSKAVAGLSPRKSQFDLGSLQVDYDFGAVRLTSTTGALTKKLDAVTDLSRFAAFYGAGATAVQDEKSTSVSQEFRLSGTGNGPLTWLAGVFYQRYKYVQNDPIVAPALGFSIDSVLQSKATESSAFFQGDYALGNGVTFGLGGRYFRTQNDLVSLIASAPGSASSSESGFTPRASAKMKFGGDNLAYALVSKGYRFGGVNITQFTPNVVQPSFVTPPTYQSDSLINYEFGLRLAPAATLRVDASVFVMDWKDLQLNLPRPGDFYGYTANVGKARSKGLELGVTWTPDSSLTLSTAATYTDARTQANYSGTSGVVASGTRLPGTAYFQIANQGSLRFAGPMETGGRVSLMHSYVGKSFDTLFKTAELGGYNIVDAGVAFARQQWELTLFARNVANKKATAGVLSNQPFYTDYYVTRPRTIGASLRFDL
jgi:outer membrane receptor protein involved in Fe transport